MKLSFLLILICSARLIRGLQCISCTNAVNDEDCLERGRFIECRNTEACYTQTRNVGNGKELITRSCKQKLACHNNHIQNPRAAWGGSQCNSEIDGSVCRCCCDEHRCNVNKYQACGIAAPPNDDEITPCDHVTALEHGLVECVDDVNKTQSVCIYECDEGYRLVGDAITKCTKPGRHNLPICVPECSNLAPSNNGWIKCSNGKKPGSECELTCEKYYIRNGKHVTKCVLTEEGAEWSNQLGECAVPDCSALTPPKNGDLECFHSKSTQEGFSRECHFTCNPGYKLRGAKKSLCKLQTGKLTNNFTEQVPVCEPTCPQYKNLRRVISNCSDENNVGSVCQFQCQNERYNPDPMSIMQNKCLPNGHWSTPPPCCRLPCPPHTIMDMFIVLDSSSSVKQPNWNLMIKFVHNIIGEWTLGPDRAQVAVVRFNSKIDVDHQLLLRNGENYTQVGQALETIPYDGKGTKTGAALRHVRESLLTSSWNRRDVTDVVLVLTDGKSSDDVVEISQLLRDDGVEMYAVGVGRRRKSQLLDITGTSDRVFSDLDSFAQFTKQAAVTIGNELCVKSCAGFQTNFSV